MAILGSGGGGEGTQAIPSTHHDYAMQTLVFPTPPEDSQEVMPDPSPVTHRLDSSSLLSPRRIRQNPFLTPDSSSGFQDHARPLSMDLSLGDLLGQPHYGFEGDDAAAAAAAVPGSPASTSRSTHRRTKTTAPSFKQLKNEHKRNASMGAEIHPYPSTQAQEIYGYPTELPSGPHPQSQSLMRMTPGSYMQINPPVSHPPEATVHGSGHGLDDMANYPNSVPTNMDLDFDGLQPFLLPTLPLPLSRHSSSIHSTPTMTPFGVLGKEATDLGTAGPHRTPGSSELPPTPADEPAVVTAPRRGRGRPKGQRNKKTGANGSGSTSQPSTPASVLARRSSKIKSSGPGPGEDLSLSLGEPALADSERAGNAGAGAGADIEGVGKTKHLRVKETISSS